MGLWDFAASGTPKPTSDGRMLQYGSGVINPSYNSAPEVDNSAATAGLVKAGGSGLSALAGALLSLRSQKKQKKIAGIQHEMKRKNYLDQVNQNLLDEGEGDQQFAHGLEDLKGGFGGVGLGESSAKNYAVSQAQHGQDLRNWALRKQRADLKYGWDMGEKIGKLQKQIERINQQNAMITAAIDTASSAASMAVMSDRNVKRDFKGVKPTDILGKLMQVPITTWRYEYEDKNVRHLGPMAQDWHHYLGFGNLHEGKQIDVVDAFGVALTAVQGLAELVSAQNERIKKLESVLKLRGERA